MEKNFDHEKPVEISAEELQQHIVSEIDLIWEQQGWVCQKEVSFVNQPIKPGGAARVQKRLTDLQNPEEVFKVLFYISDDSHERQEQAKVLDFIIAHEASHCVQEIHRAEYETKISEHDFNDLNETKNITPVDFYSGANEIASDVIALNLSDSRERQEACIKSLLAVIEQDIAKEKAGEYQPFYRDQARFEALLNYLEGKKLLSPEENGQIGKMISFWRTNRDASLSPDDRRRFDQMREYLTGIIQKAEVIVGKKYSQPKKL